LSLHSAVHHFPTRRSSDLNSKPGTALPNPTPQQTLLPKKDILNLYINKAVEAITRINQSRLKATLPACQPNIEPEASAFKVVIEDRKSTRLNSSHVSISYA